MKKHENGVFVYAVGAFSLAMAAVALAPLGCGDDSDGSGGSGGSGGTTTTGGAAGSGGSAGGGGSAGTDGGADDDAGPGEPCGGFAGVHCSAPETMYCDFPDKAECGEGDIQGTCMPRPEICVAGGPEVCGCNGTSYPNECEAHRAGTDTHSTACPSPAH